jgi:hypothetical protein
MAFLNDTYTQDSVRRAMRGQTPPFLPPELETPTPPPPPLESPETARYRELVAQGAPEHPKHGKLRTVLETIGKVYGVNEEITDPGYTRDRDSYYEKLAGAKEAATIAEKEARLAADLESERARKASYDATAERQRALRNAPAKAERQVIDGQLYERDATTGTWKVVAGAPKPREFRPGYGYEGEGGKVDIPVPLPPKLNTPGRPMVVSPGATVIDPATGRPIYTAPNRPPVGSSGGGGRVPPTAFVSVENKKTASLLEAKRNADKTLIDYPEKAEQVYANLRQEYQQIQNNYEAGVKALGGSVEHYEYPDTPEFIAQQTGAPSPATPAPQPAPRTPKQLTVEKAAEYLRKAGGNKDLAREMARKDGWNF